MDVRALVTREADETDFARLSRLQDGLHSSAFGKNAIRIGVANDFVELEQMDPVSLKAAQRLFDLTGSGSFGAPVNLGHQKRLLAIPVAQRVAHADFTLAAVVVPAVVEKVDTLVEARADDANAFLGIRLIAKMIATESYKRNFLFAAAQGAVRNAVPGLRSRGLLPSVRQENGRCRKPQESPPGNVAVYGVISSRILRGIWMTSIHLAWMIFLVIHDEPPFSTASRPKDENPNAHASPFAESPLKNLVPLLRPIALH